MDTRKSTSSTATPIGIRVDCITRNGRVSPYNRIRAVGGPGSDGMRWRLSEGAVIAAIESERATFYVAGAEGRRWEIVVAQGQGKPYLKTESDGDAPDRLLALSDCS